MTDIVIKRGVNNREKWSIKDTVTKALVDIRTGYEIRGQIRPIVGSPVLLFEWDSTKTPAGLVGEVVLGNGSVEIKLTAAQSTAIDDDYKRCVYQVLLKRVSDGDVSEIDSGTVTFKEAVVQ